MVQSAVLGLEAGITALVQVISEDWYSHELEWRWSGNDVF